MVRAAFMETVGPRRGAVRCAVKRAMRRAFQCAFEGSVLLMAMALLAMAPAPASAQPATGEGGAFQGGTFQGSAMPDAECLRMMRRARVLELRSRPADQVVWLKRARAECNEPVAALIALLRVHRDDPLPENEVQEYRRELIAAFEDPDAAPPPGVLEYIARGEDTGETVLLAALGLVERRLGQEGVDRRRFLRLKALLEQRLDRPAEATAALTELRSLEPENEEVAWALLRILSAGRQWGAAADLLGEMVDDGAVALRLRHARALARAGRSDEANRQLELLADEVDRNDVLATRDFTTEVLAAAWNLRDAGRSEDAERLFLLVSQFAPAGSWPSVEAKGALVHLYGTAAERAAHQQTFAERWQNVTDPLSLLNEGANQLSAGNYDRAIELLKRAAEELGHLEAVWYNLGTAAYRAERWDEAWPAFDRAAELNDQQADFFFFSGMALRNLERWEDAVPRFLRTLELDPERRHVHHELWVCYRVLGREEDAARHRAAYARQKEGER